MKFSVILPLAIATSVGLSAQTKPAAAKPKSPATQASPAKPAAKPSSSPTSSATPAPAATPASGDEKIVMVVGDEKITAKEFEVLIEALPEQFRQQARGPMKRQVAEQIARVKLLASEARKRGLDKDPTVQARMRFQDENMLAGATYNDMISKTKVDDAAISKYYDEHKNEYESVQARHILIRYKGSQVPLREGKPDLSEEQALAKAQEVKKQLAAGGDFATIAKAESDDAGSGVNGGDLGTFSHGQMVAAFEQAAFSLPVGQVSEPIKTQFGYHLIKVDKHESKDLASVRGEVEAKLRPEAAREAVENLRKTSTLTLDETFFGPPPPPPGAGPAGPAGSAPHSTAPAGMPPAPPKP